MTKPFSAVSCMTNSVSAGTTSASQDSNTSCVQHQKRIKWVCVWLFWPLASLAIVIAILVGIGFGWLGSWNAVVAWLRNDALAIESRDVSFGMVSAGHEASASFVLTNICSKPLTIWGAQTSCGCLSMALPRKIAPHERITLSFTIKTTERDIGAELRHQALLYLSVPGRPVVLTMRGNVVKEL